MEKTIATEFIHIYLATGLSAGAARGDEDEDIQVETVSLLQALELVDRGEICDGKSIIGLLTVKAHTT